MTKLESIIYWHVPQIDYKGRLVYITPIEFLKHNYHGFRFSAGGGFDVSVLAAGFSLLAAGVWRLALRYFLLLRSL